MNRKLIFPVAVLTAFSLGACSEQPTEPQQGPQFGWIDNQPTGKHFTLNIHGTKDKQAAMDAANQEQGRGSSIFVALYFDDGNNTGECWEGTNPDPDADSGCPIDATVTNRKNKISLIAGTDFAVLDANATDGDGALFQLPTNVSYTYDVYAIPLGTPANDKLEREAWARLTTCGTFEVVVDPDGVADSGDEYTYEEVLCSLDNYVAMRETGKPRAELVNDELLFIEVNIVDDGSNLMTCLGTEYGYDGETYVPLFDSCFEGFFWDYDNHGLRLLQLRFYPKPEA